MKSKFMKIFIPYILMIIMELGYFFIVAPYNMYGEGFTPHIGLIFAAGLLLGPYGAIGSSLGEITLGLFQDTPIHITLISGFISFAVSYLGYKLWYSRFRKEEIQPPVLTNSFSLIKILIILFITGLIYSLLKPESLLLIDGYTISSLNYKYFFNYFNFGFIFGIIGIWITRRLNYYYIPKTSKSTHELFYKIVFILLILLTLIFGLDDFLLSYSLLNMKIEFPILTILLCIVLMKPITHKIHIPNKTASEKIMNLYLLIALLTLILMIIRVIVEDILYESTFFDIEDLWALILTADIDFLIFFLPATIILRFVERKLIKPIHSLSKIEGFIQKEKKIETEGLLEIYSPYLDEPDEIGTLARNYSNLIISNNHYIENINEIESERERIKAELDIAKKIQQSSLPTEEINNDYYDVFGFCKPAKEVGGDFYDYFEIDDENLAIVIGDASGKGVPAALLTTTTQTLIRELFNHEKDPSEILNSVNNHIYVNNSETMFITLWLGIYNKKTNILTFSNAGHNPPLIRKHDKFELMPIDTGIVLGILEDYEFTTEEIEFSNEIILYTDGITDAINKNDEAYGEKRLIDFFNRTKMKNNIINNLIEDVNKFTQDTDQFDDMTLLILKKNN